MKQGYYIYKDGIWIPTLTIPGEKYWCPTRRKQMFRSTYAVRSVDSLGNINDTPPAFECDGGSKPWWSWLFVGHPFDRHFPAYFDHDSEYDKIREADLTRRQRRKARKLADWRFLDGMRWLDNQHGITSRRERAKKHIKYRAVRAMGWRSV